LAIVVGLLVVVFGAAVFVGLRINDQSRRTFAQEAIPLKGLVQDLVLQLVNQETGVRGFIATGNPASLKPYRAGRTAAADDLRALQPFLPRHPVLARLLAELRPRIARLDRELLRQIRLVRSGPAGRERARAGVIHERRLFDEIRVVAERMLAQTEAFVVQAQRRQDEDVRRLIGVLAVLGLGALGIGGLLAFGVPRKLQQAHDRERRARTRVERMRSIQQQLSGSLDAAEVRRALLRLPLQLDGFVSAALVVETPGGLVVRRGEPGAGPESREIADDAVERAIAGLGSAGRDIVTGLDGNGSRIVVLDLGGDADERELLILEDARRPDADDDPDRTVLDMLARQGRQALANARLYEREHRIAETLQRSAMPTTLTDVEGLRFAARYLPGSSEADIGGDWYDVCPGPHGSVCAVVGDVGGKGVIAAAQMGQLRSVVRALAPGADGPGSLLDGVNRYLEGQDAVFATLAVAIIDPATARCRFALAGHPPPLLLEPGGHARFLEGGQNVPLGVDVDLPTADDEVELGPGSMLLMYTDGLVEKRTQPLDEGLARLRSAANAALRRPVPFLDGLLEELVPEERRADDVALLSIAVEDVTDGTSSIPDRAGTAQLAGGRGGRSLSRGRAGAAPAMRARAVRRRRRGGKPGSPSASRGRSRAAGPPVCPRRSA
jgi:serine phosphatase RsbU (regulator of sigma subunit)/CHASE3 domain sensor protein